MRKNKLRPLDRSLERVLHPMRGAMHPEVAVGRSLVTIHHPSWLRPKEVILLHIPFWAAEIQDTPLMQLAFGDKTRYTGEGFVLNTIGCPWCERAQEPTPSFNCHSYSLGERVGLKVGDWVEGVSTDLSENSNPAEILFDYYFRIPEKIPKIQETLLQLEKDPALEEDDVIDFVRYTKSGKPDHMHSGRVYKLGGKNMLASKMGQGRLIVTTLQEMATHEKSATEIRVYRFR